LFLFTFLSTFLVGGALYSLSLISILLAHEMGHFFMSRFYYVRVSFPFFIPFPVPPFGTLGAVIKMKSPIPNRRALFDIGLAGPLAGLIIAIPLIAIGFKLSTIIPYSQGKATALVLSDPPLFKFIQWIVIGRVKEGFDVQLHPIAYAGWVGLFVTALNLLPIGQLDGGHIIYAIFGEKSKKVYLLFLLFLIIIAIFYNIGWFLLIVFMILVGLKHPYPIDDITPLDFPRKVMGTVAFLVFVLSFSPIPFPNLSMGLIDLLKIIVGGR